MIKPRYLRVALLAQLKGTWLEWWAAEMIYREVDRLEAQVRAERKANAIDVKAKGSLAIPTLWPGYQQARAAKAAKLAQRQAEAQMQAWLLQAQMMSAQAGPYGRYLNAASTAPVDFIV